MAREVREIEFVPPDIRSVVEEMVLIAGAGDGWINLLPGVPDDQRPGRPSLLGSMLGASPPAVTMCTWMPPRRARRSRAGEVIVGVMHPRGRHAIAQLADQGIPLPKGWRVRQDNARRGLIVGAPEETAHASVLDWMLAAGEALSSTPLTGTWQARVFMPAHRR